MGKEKSFYPSMRLLLFEEIQVLSDLPVLQSLAVALGMEHFPTVLLEPILSQRDLACYF